MNKIIFLLRKFFFVVYYTYSVNFARNVSTPFAFWTLVYIYNIASFVYSNKYYSLST